MTPKEKADELYENLYDITTNTKKCAILTVNEILKSKQEAFSIPVENSETFINYWINVKKELENYEN